MKKILIVFGTRPEAIKLAPLINEFKADSNLLIKICNTGQHKEMLDSVLEFFSIKPDFNLSVMKANQTLEYLTNNILNKLEDVIDEFKPDLVIVQGDTTTAFVGALAAYYKKIPVAHVEAGLRSYDNYQPFPEEINRKLISQIASLHFCPTINALRNLKSENIVKNVFLSTNTVIDALLTAKEINDNLGDKYFFNRFKFLDSDKRIILVTAHRRENIGLAFRDICKSIKNILNKYDDIQVVYPIHMNPNFGEKAKLFFKKTSRIHLIEPLNYQDLVWMMSKSFIVMTDSGGIQEEAPTFGKPILVLRNVTERQEGIENGTAILVGTDTIKITENLIKLFNDPIYYSSFAGKQNPYGSGEASKIIHQSIIKFFN